MLDRPPHALELATHYSSSKRAPSAIYVVKTKKTIWRNKKTSWSVDLFLMCGLDILSAWTKVETPFLKPTHLKKNCDILNDLFRMRRPHWQQRFRLLSRSRRQNQPRCSKSPLSTRPRKREPSTSKKNNLNIIIIIITRSRHRWFYKRRKGNTSK